MSGSTRRTIPPLVDDPRAVNLTLAQRHTLALLPLALDDYGRTLDDPGRVNGLLWGSLWRDHGPDALDADLAALAEAGLVTRYEVEGVRYVQMLDWDDQQVVSRRSPSRYPAPPTGTRSARPGAKPGSERGFGHFGRGWAPPFADRDVPEAVWRSVDSFVDAMAGATEKLSDPAVQGRAVSFLADMAGQVDPDLAAKVRERASQWFGATGYGQAGGTPPWARATQDDGVRLTVVKDEPQPQEATEQEAAEQEGAEPREASATQAAATAAEAEFVEELGKASEEDPDEGPIGSTPQDAP